ncbi:hypothetical protein IY145_00275 [Methylosinus sp. H3A]|uniref:hypothetical protein n=1 Tax=Methylosinus sp. H3A TaxID=2785786 RepID=UPI0018C213B0|nr:hypothetical protein [Methylosinus sp. H3A]MBG0807879.1 hypothetical protein [Methylosinus sp. H3A]
MGANFLDHIKVVEDGRIPGMTSYPLDEVLLTILIGLLCRMEDFDEFAMFGEEQIDGVLMQTARERHNCMCKARRRWGNGRC